MDNFSESDNFAFLRNKVLSAIAPIKTISDSTNVEKDFLFTAQRTEAGRGLPPYYLCYFLLVDLLGFKNLGQWEKTAWSVPLDYQGNAFLIEHRKMGLGVFAQNAKEQNPIAQEIVDKMGKAVALAKPYFEWKANEAAKNSHLNVKNHHHRLMEKFYFFVEEYRRTACDAEERSGESIPTRLQNDGISIEMPAFQLRKQAEWMAIAAVESFFSWTEHVFIHWAILKGKLSTGQQVAVLAGAEWKEKFKTALEIDLTENKNLFDRLLEVRRQLRNYLAHGAFEKNGEAFEFHSKVGAVPLQITGNKAGSKFSFQMGQSFKEKEVVSLMEEFITHMQQGSNQPAWIYVSSGLPLILTMVADGRYQKAMVSTDAMKMLVEHLSWQFDQAANMDW